MQAFIKKNKKSELIIVELEQNLNVKKIELEYLADLFEKEKKIFSLELENANKKSDILQIKINNISDSILIKDNNINELKTKLDDVTGKLSEKESRITELETKVNNFNNILSSEDEEIDNLKETIKKLSSKISDLTEVITQKDNNLENSRKENLTKEKTLEIQKVLIEKIENELRELKGPEIITPDVSNVIPKPADVLGNKINEAFNQLLGKLNSLQGYEFGRELQAVSDLIFESIGFCSTLHKITIQIDHFKPIYKNLDENDISKIISSIDIWKGEIFSKTGMHL